MSVLHQTRRVPRLLYSLDEKRQSGQHATAEPELSLLARGGLDVSTVGPKLQAEGAT